MRYDCAKPKTATTYYFNYANTHATQAHNTKDHYIFLFKM